jgi:hypothetical protein
MDDEEKARHERLLKEEKELQQVREDSRIRVGVSADDLRRVVGAAMARAGTSLDKTRGESVGNVTTFNLDPSDPAFAKDAGWQDVTAIWTEAERERKPLRPLGESGEERSLNQLEEALRNARAAPSMAAARVQALVERDIADLLPTLERLLGSHRT